MYIKSYETKRFAGLRDIKLDFEPGINVILGPNEAGKSTIIEGIHASLFKDTKVGRIRVEDKDFTFRFMPKPSGDFIDGRVVLKSSDGAYEIAKEWGASPSIEMTTPEGNILKDEKAIKKNLKELLVFGESTYTNIVFSKQRDLKQSLFNIIESDELTQEINDLLRMTLMELDGISIDSIESNIEEEIDSLYKRWDREKSYPENNRGVNNPYKVGLGKIVEAYYTKENLKRDMEQAQMTEIEFEEVSQELKKLRDERESLAVEKKELEAIESDVNQRAILNAELGSVDGELKALMKINSQWPRSEEIIKQLDEKLEAIEKKKENLAREKADLEKATRKEELEAKLDKLEEIEGEISSTKEKLGEIPHVTREDIEKLASLQKEVLTLETAMEAGKILGLLKKAGGSVYITRDFGDREKLELNEEFEANGLVEVEYGDEFFLEIKTGEIDFEELNVSYRNFEDEYKELLENLDIENIDLGRLHLEKIEEKERRVKSLTRELEIVLDGTSKEEIEAEIKELKDIKTSRSLEEIEENLREVASDEMESFSERKTKASELESWENDYESHEDLFDLVIEKRTVQKEKKESLEGLKPLPEEFSSVEDFKERLLWLRERLSSLEGQLDNLVRSYHEAKNELSENTFEELKAAYMEAEKVYERNISRGEKLLEIREVFVETKERLASNPMESLVQEFSRLLELITHGNYKTGDIDEDFNIRLENHSGEIPLELLSAGTHDSVTLALRFSLLKHIFNDMDGFVILDDCLVDLDPGRKKEAVNLINDFARDYQIIFTTCDPRTAEMLGGNIIEIG